MSSVQTSTTGYPEREVGRSPSPAEGRNSRRRYAIVGAFAIAALITPPDITSMLMLGIPMCLLYELGVIAVRIFLRRSEETAAKSASTGT